MSELVLFFLAGAQKILDAQEKMTLDLIARRKKDRAIRSCRRRITSAWSVNNPGSTKLHRRAI